MAPLKGQGLLYESDPEGGRTMCWNHSETKGGDAEFLPVWPLLCLLTPHLQPDDKGEQVDNSPLGP